MENLLKKYAEKAPSNTKSNYLQINKVSPIMTTRHFHNY